MSSNTRPPAQVSSANGSSEPSYFEQQRAILVAEIAQSMEHVLQNINKLNRSLEGVIAVGNEFSSVEALWSQFENVMAKETEAFAKPAEKEEDEGAAEGASKS